MSKNKRVEIPDVVFHAVAFLVPKLMYVAETYCGIEPMDLFVLWHIRHFGAVDGDQRNIMLRHELGQMLQKRFRLADAQITKMLNCLQDGRGRDGHY